MTFDRIIIPGLSEDEQLTLDLLGQRLHDKAPRNFLRACYYDGKRAVRQVGSIIPPQYYSLALALGWSAKAVDVPARRCNLDRFVWTDGDIGSIGVAETWDGNHLGTEISGAVVSSLIHGTSYLINTRGDVDEGEPAGLIHVKDAMNATGEWNSRTRHLDNLYSVTGRDAEGHVTSFALYLDGLTISAEKDEDGKWIVDRSEHPWGVPAEAMVYKPRPNRPFGYSRISDVTMSMHDSALRTLIRTEGHADVFSYPEMWLLGADESIFRNTDGSQKASWQVMLGRIKAIPDDDEASAGNERADVKQFPASSPTPHIDLFKQQAANFAGEHDLPVSSLGVQAESNTTIEDGSNDAERQLIAEAEGACEDWSLPVRNALLTALAMSNDLDAVPTEWRSIAPKWRDPRYLSRAAQADAGMKQLTAVPWLAQTEVGLELLGLDEQQIQRALAEQRRLGGSAALRAIADAAANNNPLVTADAAPVPAG